MTAVATEAVVAPAAPRGVSRWLREAFVLLLRVYQLVVSPLLGPACRFEPSCSVYAIEAVRRHGVVRGSWLATRRIGRCHPFGASGYDPVP